MHGMKNLLSILCTAFFLLPGYLKTFSQDPVFSAVNEADVDIRLESLYTESSLIQPFISKRSTSGVSITGDIWLNSDSSLVRVVLVDKDFNEYLLYEAYPLLENSADFSIDRACEETALLNNVIPLEIQIKIIDAVLFLKTIHLSSPDQFTTKSAGNVRSAQQVNKIERLNRNLRARDIPWEAGETSFSRLSYEEKKASFGGELPNLGGFEYYTGGIFVMPGVFEEGADAGTDAGADLAADADSPYVKEFDWRNRHGINWMTPVKNQSSCGSCWAFAAAGATEHLTNIYFNRKLDLNLSEQYLVSCSGTGSCNGGWTYRTAGFIQNTGIVEEDCFPYQATDLNCANLCSSPEENLRIGGYRNHISGSIDAFKKVALDGASTFSIIPWRHSITLVGYKTLQAGDRVYIKTSSESRWFTINPQSSLVGYTAWILKNSWGTWWGDGGYAYVVTNRQEINPWHTSQLLGPVYSQNFNNTDIACTDNDGDGYYYWGNGSKPAHCPPCPDEPDGDDSNACFGPMDKYGNLQAVTSSPVTNDVIIFEDQEVPDLTATGNNILWWSDYNKTQLLHSGPSYRTGISALGSYTFYVTQTIGSCESVPKRVLLSILEGTEPPTVEDLTVCQGKTGILKAIGTKIRWYADAGLSNLLFEGEEFLPSETDPGNYKFYVTQTTGGVESPYAKVIYRITETPLPVYVEDRTYCTEEGLFMYAQGHGIRWYKSGFINELVDIRDNRTYQVVNIGTQVWMAENLNIGERIDGSKSQANNGIIEKYNYSDKAEYGADHGGLYQWDELMLYTTEVGTQGICPAGWHIPSHEEWKQMEIEIGMSEQEADNLGLRGSDEGTKLLEGGSSGFESLFSGKRNINGYYENMDHYATFWTSDGYTRTLGESFTQVYASKGDDRENGFSVRCIMDESSIVSVGNKLYLSDYTPGDYTFKVTTTTSGCESPPVTSKLSLKETPDPPVVPDLEVCQNDPSPVLVAEGEEIKWYQDPPADPLVDPRDGKIYDVVGIGKQVWMAENIDVGTQIPGSQNQEQNGIIEKYHFNNDLVMGEKYGGLYQWNELMNYSTLENTQGICPDGWEVPSNKDWMKLEMELGMNQSEAALYEWRGSDQGTRLKEGGSSGFEVLFGGKRSENGQFKSEGSYATIWNSSAYSRTFENWWDRTQVYNSRFDDHRNSYSVRCMMNDSAYTSRGNQMAIPDNEPGTYSFEVTQTIDGCESESTLATLIIKETPIPPEGKDTSMCEGDSIPPLVVSGEKISWYSEKNPGVAVHTGNTYHSSDSLPGIYTYFITRRKSDCESLADTVSLEIKPKPDSPLAGGLEVCEGEVIPFLVAEGVDINWYKDTAAREFLASGSEFSSEQTEPGKYTYYATQSLLACESDASPAILIIFPLPPPPQTENLIFCENETLSDLTAIGENISWYNNEALSELVHQGPALQSLADSVGIQAFYVTQTINNCEGPAEGISLTIYPVPEITLGEDTSIFTDETLILGPYLVEYSYLWNNATENAFLVINGEEYGVGEYPVSVQVTHNGCIFRDSLLVTIEKGVGMDKPEGSTFHNIYPNPTGGDVTVEFTREISQDILVEVYHSNGSIVQQFSYQDLPLNTRNTFNIHLDIPGFYFLKIIEGEQIFNYTLIRH